MGSTAPDLETRMRAVQSPHCLRQLVDVATGRSATAGHEAHASGAGRDGPVRSFEREVPAR